MAVEFRLGDRRPGRREHDHQRCYARDAVVGGAQVDDCGAIVSIVRRFGAPLLDTPESAGRVPHSFAFSANEWALRLTERRVSHRALFTSWYRYLPPWS